jgi:hypothetical protein
VTAVGIALAVVAAFALIVTVPRLLLSRAQDRLARRILAEETAAPKLLTRAELVAGEYRRLPGVLGLSEDRLEFTGLFGESVVLPTMRIAKISTGTRLASGRRLLRLEVLRLTPAAGEELEFVLAPASASAWRSHLGLWAVEERRAAMDLVTPGRK